MLNYSSRKRILSAISIDGLKMILLALALGLLLNLTGCSLISSKSVREVEVPVPIPVPKKILCRTLVTPKIPELEITWHPVPVKWMRNFIPEYIVHGYEEKFKLGTLTEDEIRAQKEHKILLDHVKSLPEGLMGNSPEDYQETGFFIIELGSWMKSKNTEVDILKSCIERHNIQAEDRLNKVKSNE